MIPNFWLRLIAFFAVCIGIVAVTPASLATVPYDGQWSASITYDIHASHMACDFEGAEIQSASESRWEFAVPDALCAAFSKFLAAETTVARNPNVYEALFEAPISGTTRTAQRASANNFLANQLQNDAQLNGMLNQELGGNVLQHMESGSGNSFLNPPGTVWHHPFDDPTVMQLLRTGEHTAPSLQPVLHPGGVGGFGNFYGP